MSKNVTNKYFIGRENQVKQIIEFVNNSEKRVLNVTSAGKGGRGKTSLIKHVISDDNVFEMFSKDNVIIREIFDFYQLDNRNRFILLDNIANQIGKENFNKYFDKREETKKESDAVKKRQLLSDALRTFQDELKNYTKTPKGKVILFFDTYETIQRRKRIDTSFSKWFIKKIVNNHKLKFIIAGRHNIGEIIIQNNKIEVDKIEIDKFTFEETNEFIEKLDNKGKIEYEIKNIHFLTDGSPVLVALTADLIRDERSSENEETKNYLQSGKIKSQAEAELRGEEDINKKGIRDDYKKYLIINSLNLAEPHTKVLLLMQLARRRVTMSLIKHVFRFPKLDRNNQPLRDEEWGDKIYYKGVELDEYIRNVIFSKLKELSYVKYYPATENQDEAIVLQDVFSDLVGNFWWDEHEDIAKEKNTILKKTIEYYEKKLTSYYIFNLIKSTLLDDKHNTIELQEYSNAIYDILYDLEELHAWEGIEDTNKKEKVLENYVKQHVESIADNLNLENISPYNITYIPDDFIAQNDTEILFSYLLKDDINRAMDFFAREFELATKQAKNEHWEQLLGLAERYIQEEEIETETKDSDIVLKINENNQVLLEIYLRKIEYSQISLGADFVDVEQECEFLIDNINFEENNIDIEYKGRIYFFLGEYYLLKADWEKSNEYFFKATNIFYKTKNDLWLHTTNRYIGYGLYRQAKFADADIFLNQSPIDFLNFTEYIKPNSLSKIAQYFRLERNMYYSYLNYAMFLKNKGLFFESLRNTNFNSLTTDLAKTSFSTIMFAITKAETYYELGMFHDAESQYKKLDKIEGLLPTLHIRIHLLGANLVFNTFEFYSFLELYRAKEFEQKRIGYYEKDKKRFNKAKNLLKKAISIAKNGINYNRFTKEAADAHFEYAEALMLEGKLFAKKDEDTENAFYYFKQAKDIAKKCGFKYAEIDALQSILNLYYFDGQEVKIEGEEWLKEFKKYVEENPRGSNYYYPNILARDLFTYGDRVFDKAEDELKQGNFKKSLKRFEKAFDLYTNAIVQKKEYNMKRYQLMQSTFNERINEFIHIIISFRNDEKSEIKKLPFRKIHSTIEDMAFVWENKPNTEVEVWNRMLDSAILYVLSTGSIRDEINVHINIRDRYLRKGDIEYATAINNNIINAYRTLLRRSKRENRTETTVEYYSKYILTKKQQAKWYFYTDLRFKSEELLKETINEVNELNFKKYTYKNEFEPLRIEHSISELLKTSLKATQIYLQFRNQFYSMFIESYINEELKYIVNNDTKLQGAISKAIEDFSKVEESYDNLFTENAKLKSEKYDFYKEYAELCYRIGESYLVNAQYDEAKKYFNKVKSEINHGYRHYDALQSLPVVEYMKTDFSDKNALEDFLNSEEVQNSNNILQEKVHNIPFLHIKRLINTGDAYFSTEYGLVEKDKPQTFEEEYKFQQRNSEVNTQNVCEMLINYVKACNYAAMHSDSTYQMTLNILQRRLLLINDKESLIIIRNRILPYWNYEENLKYKQNDIKLLLDFLTLNIRIIQNNETLIKNMQ